MQRCVGFSPPVESGSPPPSQVGSPLAEVRDAGFSRFELDTADQYLHKFYMNSDSPVVCLIAPNGMRVETSDFFDCPEEIIVTKQGVSFDGWVLRTDEALTDAALAWIIQQATLMSDNDNEDRALAMLDAIEANWQAGIAERKAELSMELTNFHQRI